MRNDVVDLETRRRAREPGFALGIAFDTDDPDFVRGWEAGLLYGRLEHAVGPWAGMYHYNVMIEATGDPMWSQCDFEKGSEQ